VASEKILEQRRALGGKDASLRFRPVIEPGMPKQVSHRSGHSRFVVPRSKHDALETRQYDCARAHRAWLERHVQRAVVESPAVEFRRRLANSEKFSVSGGILVADSSIARRRDYRSVANDYRANRDLVSLYRVAGEIERIADVLFIRCL
jgi:hypothetical protein